MQKYYNLFYFQNNYDLRTACMLHQLANLNVGDLYTPVNSENNSLLDSMGGFLKIPRNVVQQIEILAHAGDVFFDLKIRHLRIKKNAQIWCEYIDTSELEEYASDIDLMACDDPAKYGGTALAVYRERRMTTTRVRICTKQMFVKADSDFVKNILNVAYKTDLKYLLPEQLQYMQRLTSIVE